MSKSESESRQRWQGQEVSDYENLEVFVDSAETNTKSSVSIEHHKHRQQRHEKMRNKEKTNSQSFRGLSRSASVRSRACHTSLSVVRHPLLEEVGLALERDHVHEIEGVRRVVVLVSTESEQETVGDELDVLTHEF